MRRVIAQQILTDEEFLPVINQNGTVLNWSPVFPMSNDIDASGALTAGHFFIGDSILAVPHKENHEYILTSSYRLIKKLHSDIWKSWKTDYKTEFQNRKQIFTNSPNSHKFFVLENRFH